jgi:hypothetical protein
MLFDQQAWNAPLRFGPTARGGARKESAEESVPAMSALNDPPALTGPAGRPAATDNRIR